MSKGEYNNFQEVIDILHSNSINYLILRNYDNLLSPEMYQDGHGDVDILCEDSIKLADAINALNFIQKDGRIRDDKIHYYIKVNGKDVSIDLRSVGDGYYCTKWQNDMLDRKIINNGFYVMEPVDHFYSLVYHAILQKRSLSDEYKTRLNGMYVELSGIGNSYMDENDFISLLDKFMMDKGYVYTYPKDILVPFRSSIVSKSLLQNNTKLRYAHLKFETKIKIIECLVNIKHLIERCFR